MKKRSRSSPPILRHPRRLQREAATTKDWINLRRSMPELISFKGASLYDVRKISGFPPCHCHKSADFVPLVCFLGTPSPLECGRHIWKPPNHKRGFPAGGHHRPHLSLSSLSHLLSSSAAVVPTNRVNFHNYWFCRRVSQSMKACILLTLLPTFSDRFDAISVFLIKLTQQRLILSKHN